MTNTFYDEVGSPKAYIEDNGNIFMFNGECLGYVLKDSVYSFKGKHLGFFKDGWIRDNDGKCVIFTRTAKNGPERRIKDIGRVKDQKSKIPDKKPREGLPKNLEVKEVWSKLTLAQFFDQ
jgi:hypothetical protein